MTSFPPIRRILLPGLLLLVSCALYGCSQKNRFNLTVNDVDTVGSTSLGEGYGWSFGNLGATMNGHGLPDHAVTFVITHKSTDG
jgi:hypothetical protein